MDHHRHVLILAFPAQGHINPALQFAKKLAKMGVKVTLTSSVFTINQMLKVSVSAAPKVLNFSSFSDGYDDGGFRFNPKSTALETQEYLARIEREGSITLRNVINSSEVKRYPVSCLVHTLFLPWASAVAREFHIPSALLWVQPATVLEIYYYYFHGYEEAVENVDVNDPTWEIQFPGLPLLKCKDLPSYILPSNDPTILLSLSSFKTEFEMLDSEEKPCNVLVNTFDALEPEALKAIENYNTIAVGPLIPSDTNSFSGDLFRDCEIWLDSKDARSVIYVSFGSLLKPPIKQMEEIASGLLKTGRPFVWVMRAMEDSLEEIQQEKLSCMEELEQKGMIMPWCSQVEVLNHPSLGCFVTHCGWNSTLESIVSGVPVVAFPHWTDQVTNAKLIQDVWRTGVRVTPNEEGTIDRDEIARCIEMVMDEGGKGLELRNNAKKWKELAREAMGDGGSLDKNLSSFLDEAGKKLT